MTEKKAFFEERTMREIRDLVQRPAFRSNGLVDMIEGIDPFFESVVVSTNIMPERFNSMSSPADGARKCYKHGKYVHVYQPTTMWELFAAPLEEDWDMFRTSFDFVKNMPEGEIDYLGYSYRPIEGRDRRKRIIPFAWLPEGLRIFSYAEKMTAGIKVEAFTDARRATKEGATVICNVPSREVGKDRYKIRLDHVAVYDDKARPAVALALSSNYAEEPEHKLYNIRFTNVNGQETSDVVTFYPQEIAAYLGAAKYFVQRMDENGNPNRNPIEASPFMIPSRRAAGFYNKLCNNVLVHDGRINNTNHLRKLYVAEKCILYGRAMGLLGLDEMQYKDVKRDGRIAEYDWSVARQSEVAVA